MNDPHHLDQLTAVSSLHDQRFEDHTDALERAVQRIQALAQHVQALEERVLVLEATLRRRQKGQE